MDDEDLNLKEGLGALSEDPDLHAANSTSSSDVQKYVIDQLSKEEETIDLSNSKCGDDFIDELVELFAKHGAHSVHQINL